jgi:hypothetical protein
LKLRTRILLLPLLAFTVLGYQNCGGNLETIVSDRWALGSGGSGGGGDSYLDGLPPGIEQTGKAFDRDPGSDNGNASLAFSTDLSSFGSTVTVKHLKNVGYLSNGYAMVDTDTTYPSNIASPSTALSYTPTNPRFQQVNAYFHLDTLIADMAGMSMFPSSYNPISVDAHCTDAQNNAYYSFDDHALCLGYSTVSGKKIWAADDKDVTVHEFGHSLNHTFSTTEIITSTPDLGALDEGFADLWAFRQQKDERISVWFGRAIYAAAGVSTAGWSGLRNLQEVKSYPTDYVDEVHDDSLFYSGAVHAVETSANLSLQQMTRLEKRLLESLQYGHGMQDAILSLKDEAADLGISATVVNQALSARGLLRKDAASDVQLNTTQPVYFIDNHVLDGAISTIPNSGGNCNSALDNGEVILLYPNLENAGTNYKGGIATELVSNSANVTVLSGGDHGFYYRLKPSTNFRAGELASLNHSTPGSAAYNTYLGRVLPPSFVVRATAAGAASLTMKITMMDTITGVPETKNLPISFTVGSVATNTSCSTDVWP